MLLLLQQSSLNDACGASPAWPCTWLYDLFDDAALTQLVDRLVTVPLILAVAFLLHRLVRLWSGRFVARLEEDIERRVARGRELGTAAGSRRSETRRLQRLHAIAGATRGAVGLVIWLTALLLVLVRFVDLRPILAGAGLVGLIVGFGAQNMIRDFLAGFSMLVEDQFGVGDWIEVDGTAGEVEQVGLRTTRMRDIDGVVWHVPNGIMGKVGNLTQRWARATLDVPFALDTDIPHARRVVQEVADDLAADAEWGQDVIGPPEIWGLQRWGPEGLSLRLVIPTRPLRNWDVNRQMRERLKHAFEREGIRMPATIHEVGAQRHGEPVQVVGWPGPPPPPDLDREPPEERLAGHPDDVETTGRLRTMHPPEPGDAPVSPQ